MYKQRVYPSFKMSLSCARVSYIINHVYYNPCCIIDKVQYIHVTVSVLCMCCYVGNCCNQRDFAVGGRYTPCNIITYNNYLFYCRIM